MTNVIILVVSLMFMGLGYVSCCELDWKYYKGSCYFFSNITKTRSDSADHCSSVGGALAIIDNREESFFISIQTNADHMLEDYVYVQGDDIDTEGTFLYDDKSDVTFYDWESGDPNDYNGQDCITLDFDVYLGYFHRRRQMEDRSCYSFYHYICEKSGNGTCDPGWTLFQGSCYYHSATEEQFSDSVDLCNAQGAYLAIISSIAESEFVSNTTSETWEYKYRIQGRDNLNEGDFILESGDPITFMDWAENEPDVDTDQDCVVLDRLPRRRMNDKSCDGERYFVCEKPGSYYVVVNKGALPENFSLSRCALNCNLDSNCTAFGVGQNDECDLMTSQCTNETICYRKDYSAN